MRYTVMELHRDKTVKQGATLTNPQRAASTAAARAEILGRRADTTAVAVVVVDDAGNTIKTVPVEPALRVA